MDQSQYNAALTGAVLYDEGSYGRIQMRGSSASDLLQRLSTNDMHQVAVGGGTRTVLTTPIGRIIDLLNVYRLEDSLLLMSGAGQGGTVFSHLRKNIFFNDQVTLEPLGRSHVQLTLYGPAAAAVLTRATSIALADLPLHATVRIALGGQDVLVMRVLPVGGAGYRLLIPTDGADAARAALADAGAVPLDAPTFDVLRIEQGYPAVGSELSQEYIPLETGLADAISFTKGCYVGQEIIARMESRNRLAKRLCGLRLTADVGDLPRKLAADGKEAGDLTSFAHSLRFGPIALAYVRTAHAEPGSQLGIAGSDVTGEVVELPF